MSQATAPIAFDEPTNARILAVSEDQLRGFQPHPFRRISELSRVDLETVLQRIAAMLEAGMIRRVRQTVQATNLAPGALVAWQVPQEKLESAFRYMADEDPFSGHVVIRSTDPESPGAQYKLWTTLKVPQGFSMDAHCRLLMQQTGCQAYRLMPAKKMFALGVGHVRRREIAPGEKTEEPGQVIDTAVVQLGELEWQVLEALKRELALDEIQPDPWTARAAEAGVDLPTFYEVAHRLDERGVIGRFSTFLEHAKKVAGQQRVASFNALFHWRVPEGRELEAGREVGRFHCMTHAYWREAGEEFNNVNVMGVSHGQEKEKVLAHKAAIDAHLNEVGIPVQYTNVFWGGRSEIKPSEIMPGRYAQWCQSLSIDPDTMRAG
jgi:DNA-binding Lrp family transcriptional regulator